MPAEGDATTPPPGPEQEQEQEHEQQQSPSPPVQGDEEDYISGALETARESPTPRADDFIANDDDSSSSEGGKTCAECPSPLVDRKEDSGDRGTEARETPREPLTWPDPEEAGSAIATSTGITNSNKDGDSINKEVNAVVRIQAHWRAALEASCYLRTLSAAASIQAWWRMTKAKAGMRCARYTGMLDPHVCSVVCG